MRIGTFLSLGSPEVAAVVSRGLDVVAIDAEHGPADDASVLAQLRACHCRHRWIRVRQLSDASRALDLGATGVVVPRIRTADEIAQLVASCHYPPYGRRGFGPSAANLYGTASGGYSSDGTADIEVWPQVETLDAVHSIEDILALDHRPTGLFLGPGDLSFELGHPGQLDHPEVMAALSSVARACRTAGWPFAVFCRSPAAAEPWIARGASVVLVASDAAWMVAGARSTWELRRGVGPGSRSAD
ncbi:MAG: HpcH/HpaI aldolase family protein [Candidatus Dormibacteria bacterium]